MSLAVMLNKVFGKSTKVIHFVARGLLGILNDSLE